MSEAIVILKPECGLGGQGSVRGIPIDGIRQIDIEVCHHRLALNRHIGRGWEVRLLQILQLIDQRGLRRTSGTRVPLNCSLIDHDGECETRVGFSFSHHEFRRVVDAVVWAIPVDDDSVDSSTNHVIDLTVNLRRIAGVVAHIHMIGTAEPQQEMSEHFAVGAGVEQRVDVDFAHI